MPYVITCGDEGVQLNEGKRLGLLGAGINLPHNQEIISTLTKVMDDEVVIASNGENDWIKQQFELSNFEQADATMQQHAQVLADQTNIEYAGFLPFADPLDLEFGVRGHMVRPKGIHIGTTLSFTLAGGEQTYHLGNFVISAEWLHAVDTTMAAEVIKLQTDFYTKLAKQELKVAFETEGNLDPELVAKNKAILLELGYTPT